MKKSEIKFGILEFKFNGSSDILKSIFSHTKWTSVLSHRKDDQLREMAQLIDIQSKDFLWDSFVLSHGIILLPLEKNPVIALKSSCGDCQLHCYSEDGMDK